MNYRKDIKCDQLGNGYKLQILMTDLLNRSYVTFPIQTFITYIFYVSSIRPCSTMVLNFNTRTGAALS